MLRYEGQIRFVTTESPEDRYTAQMLSLGSVGREGVGTDSLR